MIKFVGRRLKRFAYSFSNQLIGSDSTSGRPIFIVGNGRSGTSWIGASLGLADDTLYYREPCHPERNGVSGQASDELWAQRVAPDEDHSFFTDRLDMAFKGWFWPGSGFGISTYKTRIGARPRCIIKDVATFTSTPWVTARWQPHVVVIFRHPGAYAASVQRLDQNPQELARLQFLLSNPGVRACVPLEMLESCSTIEDPFAASIAAWAIRTRIICDDIANHPEWQIIYYEDFAMDPVGAFQKLYDCLDLPWNSRIEDQIKRSSSSISEGQFSTSRISASRIEGWKDELSDANITIARRILQPFALPIYNSDEDWASAP